LTSLDAARSTIRSLLAACLLLIFVALPVGLSVMASPQSDDQCKSGSWRVLVGSIDRYDADRKTVQIRIRGGAESIPQRWAVQDWAKVDGAKSAEFPIRDFAFQTRAEANQQAQFEFDDKIAIFRSTTRGLETLDAKKIESGTSALFLLVTGQCWPSSEMAMNRLGFQPRISRLVLLQACIEESCVKSKCKGKSGCKEKVCNCESNP
jgi:hypothetical protein